MVVIIRGLPLPEEDRTRENRNSIHSKIFYPDVRKAVLITGRSPLGPWDSMLRLRALAGWCALQEQRA